jgi:hypothetical protein
MSTAPGSAQSLWLIVSDIQAARDELAGRGVEVSEVFHFAGWNRVDPDGRLSGSAPGEPRADYEIKEWSKTAAQVGEKAGWLRAMGSSRRSA